MTYEAPDRVELARDFQTYTDVPVAREWDELMRRFQQPIPSVPGGTWWAPMDKVFDLNWQASAWRIFPHPTNRKAVTFGPTCHRPDGGGMRTVCFAPGPTGLSSYQRPEHDRLELDCVAASLQRNPPMIRGAIEPVEDMDPVQPGIDRSPGATQLEVVPFARRSLGIG